MGKDSLFTVSIFDITATEIEGDPIVSTAGFLRQHVQRERETQNVVDDYCLIENITSVEIDEHVSMRRKTKSRGWKLMILMKIQSIVR